jgi:hypothetical protein
MCGPVASRKRQIRQGMRVRRGAAEVDGRLLRRIAVRRSRSAGPVGGPVGPVAPAQTCVSIRSPAHPPGRPETDDLTCRNSRRRRPHGGPLQPQWSTRRRTPAGQHAASVSIQLKLVSGCGDMHDASRGWRAARPGYLSTPVSRTVFVFVKYTHQFYTVGSCISIPVQREICGCFTVVGALKRRELRVFCRC